MPAKHGLAVTGFDVQLDGDVATITGSVASQEVREKIVLAIGNTNGVAKVDDRLEVAAAAAAPASAGAESSAPSSAPSGASTMYGAEGRQSVEDRQAALRRRLEVQSHLRSEQADAQTPGQDLPRTGASDPAEELTRPGLARSIRGATIASLTEPVWAIGVNRRP